MGELVKGDDMPDEIAERLVTMQDLEALRRQVELIDAQGTRGVGLLISTQVGELNRSLSDMRQETREWQHGHGREHEQEARDRATGRRWMVGTLVAAAGVLVAILALVVDIAGQVRR